jgi:hypothetical protein
MNGIKTTIAAAVAFAAAAAPLAAEAHDHRHNGGNWGRPPVQRHYQPPVQQYYVVPQQHHHHRGNDLGAFLGGLGAGAGLGILLNGGLQQQFTQPQYDPGYQPPTPECTYRGQHQCINPYTGGFVR